MTLDDLALARAFHVLAVILWIGGVAFVTTVALPAVRRTGVPENWLETFERLESRFANQARGTTLIAGASGFYMVWVMDLWGRFLDAAYWWMHAMVLVWVIFTLMLFVLEPLVLHARLRERARRDPEGTFALVQRLHWVLLTLSLVTAFGAVAGAHGWLLFT